MRRRVRIGKKHTILLFFLRLLPLYAQLVRIGQLLSLPLCKEREKNNTTKVTKRGRTLNHGPPLGDNHPCAKHKIGGFALFWQPFAPTGHRLQSWSPFGGQSWSPEGGQSPLCEAQDQGLFFSKALLWYPFAP